ncbi:4'-phosphopantetheinyl transferase [Streptomyces sp. NPDC102259]|uniref:4'-phosphopantetheinyl transferase n=1 Tax=Streptomyces sp. NPDC102259 TaxID=3366148 RepID=UPI00381A8E9F
MPRVHRRSVLCTARLEKLGTAPQPVLPGQRGAPRWPDGLVGSMTHCEDYCAAALVRPKSWLRWPSTLNVTTVSPTMPWKRWRCRLSRPECGISPAATPLSTRTGCCSAPRVRLQGVVSLTGKSLDFLEADIEIAPAATAEVSRTFRTRLLVPGPLVDGHRIEAFDGRWTAHRNLLSTAVVVHHF